MGDFDFLSEPEQPNSTGNGDFDFLSQPDPPAAPRGDFDFLSQPDPPVEPQAAFQADRGVKGKILKQQKRSFWEKSPFETWEQHDRDYAEWQQREKERKAQEAAMFGPANPEGIRGFQQFEMKRKQQEWDDTVNRYLNDLNKLVNKPQTYKVGGKILSEKEFVKILEDVEPGIQYKKYQDKPEEYRGSWDMTKEDLEDTRQRLVLERQKGLNPEKIKQLEQREKNLYREERKLANIVNAPHQRSIVSLGLETTNKAAQAGILTEAQRERGEVPKGQWYEYFKKNYSNLNEFSKDTTREVRPGMMGEGAGSISQEYADAVTRNDTDPTRKAINYFVSGALADTTQILADPTNLLDVGLIAKGVKGIKTVAQTAEMASILRKGGMSSEDALRTARLLNTAGKSDDIIRMARGADELLETGESISPFQQATKNAKEFYDDITQEADNLNQALGGKLKPEQAQSIVSKSIGGQRLSGRELRDFQQAENLKMQEDYRFSKEVLMAHAEEVMSPGDVENFSKTYFVEPMKSGKLPEDAYLKLQEAREKIQELSTRKAMQESLPFNDEAPFEKPGQTLEATGVRVVGDRQMDLLRPETPRVDATPADDDIFDEIFSWEELPPSAPAREKLSPKNLPVDEKPSAPTFPEKPIEPEPVDIAAPRAIEEPEPPMKTEPVETPAPREPEPAPREETAARVQDDVQYPGQKVFTKKNGNVELRDVPLQDLHLDPSRFQFRTIINSKGVELDRNVPDVFDPDLAGTIYAWRDPADGKLYVVNGHHRYNWAQKLGQEYMPKVEVLNMSAEEAKNYGARINIAEGAGKAIDAAHFFKTSKISLNDAKKMGLSNKHALDGQALANLEPSLWEKYRQTYLFGKAQDGSKLSEPMAIAIGKHVDPADQPEALKMIIEDKYGIDDIADLGSELRMAARNQETDMFGEIISNRPLLREQLRLKGTVRDELLAKWKVFGGKVANKDKAALLSEAGNVINVEANQAIARESRQAADYFEHMYTGIMRDDFRKAAERLQNGANIDTLKKNLIETLKQNIQKYFKGAKPNAQPQIDTGGSSLYRDALQEDVSPAVSGAGREREPAGMGSAGDGGTGTPGRTITGGTDGTVSSSIKQIPRDTPGSQAITQAHDIEAQAVKEQITQDVQKRLRGKGTPKGRKGQAGFVDVGAIAQGTKEHVENLKTASKESALGLIEKGFGDKYSKEEIARWVNRNLWKGNAPKDVQEAIDQASDAYQAFSEVHNAKIVDDLLYETSTRSLSEFQAWQQNRTLMSRFMKKLSVPDQELIGRYLNAKKGLKPDLKAEPETWDTIKDFDEYLKRIGLEKASPREKDLAERAYRAARVMHDQALRAYDSGLMTREQLAEHWWEYMPRDYEAHHITKVQKDSLKKIIQNPSEYQKETVEWAELLSDPKAYSRKVSEFYEKVAETAKDPQYVSQVYRRGFTRVPEGWKSWVGLRGKYVRNDVYKRFEEATQIIKLKEKYLTSFSGTSFARKAKINNLDLGSWTERLDIPEEIRKVMGEIQSPAFPVAKRIALAERDLQFQKLFKTWADNPDYVLGEDVAERLGGGARGTILHNGKNYVRLPNTESEHWGPLAGKYIDENLHEELIDFFKETDSVLDHTVNIVQSFWKPWMTAYRSSTHINNTVGNLYFANLAGMPLEKILPGFADAGKDILQKSPVYLEARQAGAIRGNYWNRTSSRGLYEKYRGLTTEKGLGKVTGTLKDAWDAPARLYDMEDQVAKLAVYKYTKEKLIAEGVSQADAMAQAAKVTQNFIPHYHRMPKIVNILDKTILPFVAFPVRATGIVMRAATNFKDAGTALRFWKYPIMSGMLASILVMNGNLKPKDISRTRQKYETAIMADYFGKDAESYGKLTIASDALTGKKLYLPDGKGGSIAVDTGKYMPGGELFTRHKDTGLPLPSAFTPSVPVAIEMVNAAFNKDKYGRDIGDPSNPFDWERIKYGFTEFGPAPFGQAKQYLKKTDPKGTFPEPRGKVAAQVITGLRYDQTDDANQGNRVLQDYQWKIQNLKVEMRKQAREGKKEQALRTQKKLERLFKEIEGRGF